jgi:PAS domain S-box-containing protein
MCNPLIRSPLSRIYIVLLVILLLFLSTCIRHSQEKAVPRAKSGVLDLTHWDFRSDGPVDLAGEYAFYWMQELTPADFSKAIQPEGLVFVKVPSYWNRYQIAGKELPGKGYATYRLNVLLPERCPRLAMKYLSMGTAFSVYLDGKKASSAGVPGRDKKTTIPRYYPHVVSFQPDAALVEMILHVSNFHHRRGGADEVIRLGDEKQIREIRERHLAFDLFLFGSIFVIALYHLGLFVLRKKDLSALYFGLFCLLIAIRLLTTGERYITHMFPNIGWSLMIRLEYLSIYLSIPSFMLFMRSLFSQEFSRKIVHFVVIVCMGLSSIVIMTPSEIFTHTLPISHLILLLALSYGVYVLVISTFRKREGALIFLIGFVILSLTAINDILHVEQIVQTGYFAPFGLFIFIFLQAFLLSMRFSRAFSAVEAQHLELRETLESYRDEITERKRAEEALHESEAKYRNILDSIEDGYYEVDLAGNLKFFNDALCEILGYPRDQLMGMNNRQYTSPETANKMYQSFNEVYRTGKASKAMGWEAIQKDGSIRHLETSITLMCDADGRPVGFRGIARDITEKMQVETQAKLHQHQLMHASKMVALGTLVSGVAHEINNPNNFIMLNAPLLLDSWNDIRPILDKYYHDNGDFVVGGMRYSELSENLPKLFSGILDGSKRIKQIVDNLKDYIRKDTSDLSQDVDINAVLRSAVSLLSNMIKKSTQHFSIDYGKSLPALKGNFQQLEQVVINLIQNACQALPDTGKGISVSTSFDGERRHIVVKVRDEGLGIPSNDLPFVTDPFFTTKGDSGGVGLGLSISSQIVKQHGGNMAFISETGIGTKVEVVLPVNHVTIDMKGESE